MRKIIIAKKTFIFFSLFSISLLFSQNKTVEEHLLFGSKISRGSINPRNGIIRCGSVEYEKMLQKKDPKRKTDAAFESWISTQISNSKNKISNSAQRTAVTIITIPVVVHVIYNGEPLGTQRNISDAQVKSQITVLNNDYRRVAGTPGDGSSYPVSADTQIQFVLAQVDPNGNPTNGIDRINTCQKSWSETDIEATLKPSTIWDTTSYLNLWSLEFTDTTILGYAQFPDGSGLIGINTNNGTASTDGVVVKYNAFGSINYKPSGETFSLNAPYNQGRTMTHEVGHWLGLRHIWGDGSDCATNTDYCNDTPVSKDANYGCILATDTCPSSPPIYDMIENYMDYTDDSCMNLFTQNQKDRIQTVMANSPRRNALIRSTKGNAIPLFANDGEVKLEKSCDNTPGSCSTVSSQKLSLYNRGSANLTRASLNYSINGGSPQTINWTGTLSTNQFANINIPVNLPTSASVTVDLISVNGSTDQRTSNNTSTGTYYPVLPPVDYYFTSLDFNLQLDKFGTETSWFIKNSNGITLFSGGPYSNSTNLPTVITKTWTLSNKDCYTFTINDSFGDGICCSGGQGFYSIKSGTTVIASGGSFGSSESTSFTNKTLATETFEAIKEIYVYPNPSQTTLNIKVPTTFGLPDALIINNFLGQTLVQKTVKKESDLSIDTSFLSNGIYFITILKDREKKTLRFIKE